MVDVYGYLDYRSFLEDWFEDRKKTNRRFSHRLFARLAGHKNPSLLLQVVHGKRNLTDASTDGFLRALKLGDEEARFFRLLVQLDQARTHEERRVAWEAIAATRRFRQARNVDALAVRFLQDWTLPAVHELSRLPGFINDHEWVADALQPSIGKRDAKRALAELEELGLLKDGKATDQTIVTPHQMTAVAVRDYHRQMMARAADCLDEVPAEQRHFGAVTVAVSEDLLPQLKDEVAAFQERLLELCDGSEITPDRVMQVNIQLFPLSKSIQESE
jgi:uncharacterized protein (TIGR02147 family)